MAESDAQLIAEQLGRLTDQLDARLKALETRLTNHQEIENERTASIKAGLADLKLVVSDHENRLRGVQDGIVTFRVWSGLISGGSGIAAIAALIKSFLP
jgi:hypothetical protein